jgi:Thrombospondin type 3 repeat
MTKIARIIALLAFAVYSSFSYAATPIVGDNIVTVDDTQWAQVDLFTNLSWNDINAVCPSGVCVSGGSLNGFDMTGWIWATTEDMNDLFNSYIGFTALGPGPSMYFTWPPIFVPVFYADGWRKTQYSAGVISSTWGLTREFNSSAVISTQPFHPPQYTFLTDLADTQVQSNQASSIYGAWFSRPAQPDSDEDGIPDNGDNCPSTPNADQLNTDGANDGGNVCDEDNDNDGWADPDDNCPLDANPNQEDGESDGVGDTCDNCLITPNPNQEDTDGDGLGDACESIGC